MTEALTVRSITERDSVKKRFAEVLGKRAPQFISSILSLANGKLNGCDPNSIVGSCMVAATLDLPVNPELGLAHLIPYNSRNGKQAQFQLGYKGLIQLAIRSGQYKHLNTCPVYEGQLKSYNKLTAELELDMDVEDGESPIGYAAYLQTITGYSHAIYWTYAKVEAHAARFSQAFKNGKKDSLWFTDFDAMAQKTVLKHLISHWGPMSVALQTAVRTDQQSFTDLSGDGDYIDAQAETMDDDRDKGIDSLGPSTSQAEPTKETKPKTKDKKDLL